MKLAKSRVWIGDTKTGRWQDVGPCSANGTFVVQLTPEDTAKSGELSISTKRPTARNERRYRRALNAVMRVVDAAWWKR